MDILSLKMSKKRTLDSFFKPLDVSPISKRQRPEEIEKPVTTELQASSPAPSSHSTYPFAVVQLPPAISEALAFIPAHEPKAINNEPELDLLYFQPYLSKSLATSLFEFLRKELFYYRVTYPIKRGPIETIIKTPRYTTVFGVDETSRYSASGQLEECPSGTPISKSKYSCQPRPIPGCLDALRRVTEGSTGETFNFCLVNYYASGQDSISFHSDDERFLGDKPAIASFSLGARRDFIMKRKPASNDPRASAYGNHGSTYAPDGGDSKAPQVKLPLGSGDMVLMRGDTQRHWLHSIPKRKGGESDMGRINITFRKALVKGGTENYYRYNIGKGPVFKWDVEKREMAEWKG